MSKNLAYVYKFLSKFVGDFATLCMLYKLGIDIFFFYRMLLLHRERIFL